MTYRQDFTVPAELMEQVAEQGLDILPELIRIVINAAMQAERSEHLQAAPYEHNPERRGYANGYKPKTLRTRVGEITLAVPQVREGGFYPQALEKGLRSERALTLALAEMYVQGVSTRKVKAITEQLCGVSISSSAVSQAAMQLDGELAKWRERPLGEYPFLFLDAYYEQVREDGQVRHLAILEAVGITPQGKREILGVSVSLSEHEVHWRAFLESLKQRGLGGVQLTLAPALQVQVSPVTIMRDCAQHDWQSLGGFLGSGANSISSRMHKPMCHARRCKPKWRRTSA
jgi:putative transposase